MIKISNFFEQVFSKKTDSLLDKNQLLNSKF